MDTHVPLVWKDGRLFATRVRVWHGNRFVFRATPIDAFRLCQQGSAIPCEEGGKIIRIELVRIPNDSDRLGPASPASPASYSPKLSYKTTLVSESGKLLPNVFDFKKLSTRDRWAYLLAQTDCLAPWPAGLPVR